METKFTKGPWLAGGTPCTVEEKEKAMSIFKESVDLTESGSGYFMEVYRPDGLRIAICGHGPNGINNANAIAAIPDLYKSLEKAIELLSSAEIQNSIRVKGMTKVIRDGGKALAKARGEK